MTLAEEKVYGKPMETMAYHPNINIGRLHVCFPLEPILGAKHKFANIAKTNTLIDVCTFTPASNDS